MNGLRILVNRHLPLSISCENIYKKIESFTKDKIIKNYLNLLSKKTKINLEDLEQYFKKTIADRVDFKNNNIRKYKNKFIFIDIIKFLAFSFYIYINRKLILSNSKKNFEIIIDLKFKTLEIRKRFKDIINFYGEKNILIITSHMNLKNIEGIKCYHTSRFKNYDINFNEFLNLFKILFISILYSFYSKTNLIAIAMSIIDSYFYYKSIFKKYSGKRLISFQHYHTNSIENFCFKKYGGKKTFAVQKNIHPLARNCFYYNVDMLFTFGDITANRAVKYGGKFTAIPTGSYYMDNNYFKEKIIPLDVKYDIILLGGNGFIKNGEYDNYDSQFSDYKEHLLWVSNFSKKYNDVNIGFKSHNNFEINGTIEDKIIKNSNIKIINKDINSYALCFASKIITSWASTMIIEMYGYNNNSFFLDPNKNNDQFIDESINWERLRITSYGDFEYKMLKILNNQKNQSKNFNENIFCKKNDGAILTIIKHLSL